MLLHRFTVKRISLRLSVACACCCVFANTSGRAVSAAFVAVGFSSSVLFRLAPPIVPSWNPPVLGIQSGSARAGKERRCHSATSMGAFAAGEDIDVGDGTLLHFVWVPEVRSTQDAMRTLLASSRRDLLSQKGVDALALSAGSQIQGRGTSGRAWMGGAGNMFLTLALPARTLSALTYPITLLPLRMGTLIAREIVRFLPNPEAQAKVQLKWPNDVLLDDGKVSGLLIEMDGTCSYYLVGIGVNVAQAPHVPSLGADRGRRAACLAQCGLEGRGGDTAKDLSIAIAVSITTWLGGSQEDTADSVIADWEKLATWGKVYDLRDGGAVVPLALETDGRLRVRDLTSGATRLLTAEYLH